MEISLLGFLLSWAFSVSRTIILSTAAILLSVNALMAFRRRTVLIADYESLIIRSKRKWNDPKSPKVAIILLAASGLLTSRIMQVAYSGTDSGGVAVSHLSVYGDWSAHLSYAASFAYSDNFPPELPTATGENFSYHFGVDWFSAMFIPLGNNIFSAMEISTILLASALPPILYFGYQRFVSNNRAALFAVLIFLLSGGTAAFFRFLVEDLPDKGPSVLLNLPRSYAFDGFDRNWVDNAVTGFLYPQRPTLIGFSAVIIVIVLLWENRKMKTPSIYVSAGVITGCLPIFHIFSFGALLMLSIFWAVTNLKKYWLYFFTPTLLLGIPVLIWQWPDRSGRGWHLLWVLGKSSWNHNIFDFFWFWILNTGLFIPIAVLGMMRTSKEIKKFALPIFAFLVIPNIAIWHFWIGNNAKYVILFLLLTAPFVGEQIEALLKGRRLRKMLSIVLLITLLFTGALDVWRAMDKTTGPYPVEYLTGSDVLVGEWILKNTHKEATFATANTNTHPVRVLTGRSVISGSPGRLNDLGVDWNSRDQDLRSIYQLEEEFSALLTKYKVTHLVLGPLEKLHYGLMENHHDLLEKELVLKGAQLVYDQANYQVFDVRELR
ncbi:MAG: hypothetical protein CL431_00445 [Acidimicrobiaceae bacterium]|nr:hypothetical protein [Acidimicrobiaceae bacterium]